MISPHGRFGAILFQYGVLAPLAIGGICRRTVFGICLREICMIMICSQVGRAEVQPLVSNVDLMNQRYVSVIHRFPEL